jgi:MraZ protein
MKQLTKPFERTLGEDGRIVIPASLRKHYSGELIMIVGPEQCLWIMTRNNFEVYFRIINDNSTAFKHAGRISINFILSTSCTTEMDKSGRIKLTTTLISHAQLSKKCLICSIDEQKEEPERLEIWNAKACQSHNL